LFLLNYFIMFESKPQTVEEVNVELRRNWLIYLLFLILYQINILLVLNKLKIISLCFIKLLNWI
jgi:hypothetical protein